MALFTHSVTWSYDHVVLFILHTRDQFTSCPDAVVDIGFISGC